MGQDGSVFCQWWMAWPVIRCRSQQAAKALCRQYIVVACVLMRVHRGMQVVRWYLEGWWGQRAACIRLQRPELHVL
jgi:hypothetical protein